MNRLYRNKQQGKAKTKTKFNSVSFSIIISIVRVNMLWRMKGVGVTVVKS